MIPDIISSITIELLDENEWNFLEPQAKKESDIQWLTNSEEAKSSKISLDVHLYAYKEKSTYYEFIRSKSIMYINL